MTDEDRIRAYFKEARWRSSSGREYLTRERTRLLAEAASVLEKRIGDLRICDVGCGVGGDLARWRDQGVPESYLAGTELIEQRAAAAKLTLPGADIRLVDDVDLPFASEVFDICSASLVLSTIRSEETRGKLLAEMFRVTAPGGLVAIYDFVVSKPWNRHVRPVTTGSLSRLWRQADGVRRAAPLLPALDFADALPNAISRGFVAALPRTHRLWVWRKATTDS